MVFEEVGLSPEQNVTGSEIQTIVTYDHETPFDVHNKFLGQSVWQESSFEVDSLETQN